MNIILGYIIVAFSVFGGFVMAGGHLGALFQPIELLMIGGAAAGAFVVGNTGKVMKACLGYIPTLFKPSKYTKTYYYDLFSLLFELLAKARKEGLMSIEGDVENPESSTIFTKYPAIMGDHHIVEFLTDYLRLMVGGNLNVFEISDLMDAEIDTHHVEAHTPVDVLAKMGDAMPAFGIVAAVMGVVHTMESLHLPPPELGLLIAHALVGTFLGILLSYGFVSPISQLIAHRVEESSKSFHCVKAVLLASLNGYAPPIAVEFGRKVLYSAERPTFQELEEELKNRRGK